MNSHHYQSVLPDNSSPLMRAIEKAFRAQLEAVNEPFPQLLNPALTPAQFLSALASEVGVKDWFESDTINEQRSIVGNGLIIQKEAGTRAGLKRAAESIGVDATVTPWFNTEDGKPYEFYIDAYVEDDETLDALAFERLSARIFHHKSERDLWLVTFKHDPILGFVYAAPVIRTRKRWVSKSIMPLYVSDISIEPTSASIREHERTISVSTTVSMSDGTTTHDVRYESSDPTIATVNDDGQVSYVSEGIVTISAISTFDDISRAECEVTTIGITFVMTVGAGNSAIGFSSSSSSFGELEPKDWNEGASTETRRVHVDIDTLQLTRSAASVGTLLYNKDYTVGAAFSTSSSVYWDLKWNEYEAVKFEFVDVGGNEHLSKPIPFSSKGGNYRIDESNYDLDTYNWLYDRRNQDVYIYVKDGSDDV
ncbi:phage tail protein I [Vibrio parahaemolyticus]|nr:phage tail protein I [Vibrio parahaemolyticus]